jgi:hypothetical protein
MLFLASPLLNSGSTTKHGRLRRHGLMGVPLSLSTLIAALRLLRHPEWTRAGDSQSRIRSDKFSTDYAEPVVVFLIGLRVNTWRRPWHVVPLLLSIPPMVQALTGAADSGLLGYRLLFGPGPRQAMLVQYWRRAADLHAFAHDPAGSHRAAQRRFFRHYAASGGAVGVWHEMLAVPAGAYHCMYGNMPLTGIGALRQLHPSPWAMADNG